MAIKLTNRKWLIVAIFMTTTLFVVIQKPKNTTLFEFNGESRNGRFNGNENPLVRGNWRGFTDAEVRSLSVLGRILFLDDPIPVVHTTNEYKILVWKYGPTIEQRHLKTSLSNSINPFSYCSVQNCRITYNDADIFDADIVLFHLHRMRGVGDMPKIERNANQIWAFSTDESPYHTFLYGGNKLADYNGLFNWSMTYRFDSDIPVPYGRTVQNNNLYAPLEEVWKNKERDVLVAVMGSNCGGSNHRWKYVKELQKHIKIDVYGGCGPLKCPGHFYKDCPKLSDYLFYLAFENSNCDQYITEKLWWNAYGKNAIPIVMGASKDNYERLVPPDSYINVENYATPADLARHILYLNKTGEFKQYYEWRRNYQVLNEHGYFGSNSYHYCRVCEALNYNSRANKVYDDLPKYWSVQRDCRPAWDET